ncbi:MAG: alpha-galactosidase [Lachnospiraceae bacterium]|nr:alpha-galactosidase [Lachnospiraceae bacterium]
MKKNIAITPPMGWNSWDCYGASVTEDIVRKNADYMAKNLKDFGWEYVVVDIQWSEPTADSHQYHPFTELNMDEYSRLIPAPNRFPSSADGKGFKPLADYVHGLGLKFGIHIMRGIPRQAVHNNTKLLGTDKTARQIADLDSICHWNTDMYGVDPEKEGAKEYYESIFKLYASWDVDFIKIDDIANHYPKKEVEMVKNALDSCGRDMVLSLSPGPAKLEEAEHLKQFANMWRITDDFWDQWKPLYEMFERAEKWCIHSGPGHWPDADMLPLGALRLDYPDNNQTQFTEDEQYTMMTLWAIMRSPMIMGGDMVYNDDFTLSLMTNKGILEMLKKARNSRPVFRKKIDGREIVLWTAFRDGGGKYMAVFNLSDEAATFSIDLSETEIDERDLTELWSNKVWEVNGDYIEISLNPHGALGFICK